MLKGLMTYTNAGLAVTRQAKRNKEIIYGQQSVKKRLAIFARDTYDYDVYSNKPMKSARQLERTLDRSSKSNAYYVKPAMHKGTYKVMFIGLDGRAYTRDDIGIADYTIPQRKIRFDVLDGVRYAQVKESIKDKRKSLSDPESKFRHEKDRGDLNRIMFFKKYVDKGVM